LKIVSDRKNDAAITAAPTATSSAILFTTMSGSPEPPHYKESENPADDAGHDNENPLLLSRGHPALPALARRPQNLRERLEQNVLCRVNNARLRWRQNGRHMRTRDDNKTSHLKGALTHALALADQVDYEIGRWVFALGQGISLPPCKKEVSAPPRGLTSDIQDAIGQRLREAYPLEQSVPAGLAGLLSRFEQQANPLPKRRDGYPKAA
jgi:hypothetical protein